MIAWIEGVIESVHENAVVLGTDAGMAWEVRVPTVVADAMSARLGQRVRLHTFVTLEQQAQGTSFTPRLIGFESPAQRSFFERFTKVKGLGNKRALKALAMPTGRIASAIRARDTASLARLPEIGKRLAETIVAELHGKIDEFADADADASIAEGKPGAAGAPGMLNDAARQTVAALVRLGEQQGSAEELVRRARVSLGQGAGDATPDELLAAAFALRS